MQDLDASTLHRTELEVKLSGLQELMDLKKTIYEQVEMQLGGQPWHTSKAKQKKGFFCRPNTERALFPVCTKLRDYFTKGRKDTASE